VLNVKWKLIEEKNILYKFLFTTHEKIYIEKNNNNTRDHGGGSHFIYYIFFCISKIIKNSKFCLGVGHFFWSFEFSIGNIKNIAKMGDTSKQAADRLNETFFLLYGKILGLLINNTYSCPNSVSIRENFRL